MFVDFFFFFFFQAEDGIRDLIVTGVQTCALPILVSWPGAGASLRVGPRDPRPGRPRHPVVTISGRPYFRNSGMHAPFSVVVITGASSGLGASLAKGYSGSQVVLGLLGRDGQRLEATARACRARGATVSSATIDVTETSAMASWLCEFDRQHPVDLLIANAGISGGPDPDNPSEGAEALARQVRVN